MKVTSPEAGQLQSLGNPPLELGQYVNAGSQLARVVQPGKLKAVLRVPENQAKDVVPGLPATIDLHNNNTVKGHVMRTDPSSVQGTVTVEVVDRRFASAGHALRSRGGRHDSDREAQRTCCTSDARASARPRARSASSRSTRTRVRRTASPCSSAARRSTRSRSEKGLSGRRQRDHLRHVAVRRHEPRPNQVAQRPSVRQLSHSP